jgi:hypothetical protein
MSTFLILSTVILNGCGKDGSKKSSEQTPPAAVDRTQAVWEGYQKIRDERLLGPEGLTEKSSKINESIAIWAEAYRDRLVYARNPGERNLQMAEMQLGKIGSEQLKLRDNFFIQHLENMRAAAEVTSELQKLLANADGPVDAKVKSHIESVIANVNETVNLRSALLTRFDKFEEEYLTVLVATLRSSVIDFALSGTVNTTPVGDLKILDALISNRAASLAAAEKPEVSGLDEAIGSDIVTKGAALIQENDRIQQEFELFRAELAKWFGAQFPS